MTEIFHTTIYPYYLLLKRQLTKQYSSYIIKNKDSYYYNLIAVTQRNSWENLILFMLEAIEQTSKYTNRLIDEIIKQMEATLE